MGGRIAVRLAAIAPDDVGRLIVTDPPLTGPGRRSYPTPLEFYLHSIDEVSRGHGLKEMRKSLDWTGEQIELRMKWLPTCDRSAVAESYRSFNEEDIFGDLPSVRSETLLLYAQRGDTVRDAEANEVVGLLPHGTKKLIPDVGHMIPWDNLKAFVASVKQFLADGAIQIR
jgi:N-formylmaleamate deformylase